MSCVTARWYERGLRDFIFPRMIAVWSIGAHTMILLQYATMHTENRIFYARLTTPLTQALKRFGKEWKKVACLVKTRTVVQTRTHAQKYFQKLTKAAQVGRFLYISLHSIERFCDWCTCTGYFGTFFTKKKIWQDRRDLCVYLT